MAYLCKVETLHFFRQLCDRLGTVYPEREAESLAFWLLDELAGLSKIEVLVNKRSSPETQAEITALLPRLLAHEPIQYVLGKAEFMGMTLEVNASVLIPRPETEEIVSRLIDELRQQPPATVLDLCTGSGCMAIGLAVAFPEAEVHAVDVSAAALEVARRNAARHRTHVHFLEINLLKINDLPFPNNSFDLLVSNPPYVLESEKALMEANVLQHEPHLALFVPDTDPLIFYQKIACFAKSLLRAGGQLCLEVNEQFGQQVADLLLGQGFRKAEVIADFRDKARQVSAIR
jgi:release factor glutamine methyltransferase